MKNNKMELNCALSDNIMINYNGIVIKVFTIKKKENGVAKFNFMPLRVLFLRLSISVCLERVICPGIFWRFYKSTRVLRKDKQTTTQNSGKEKLVTKKYLQ